MKRLVSAGPRRATELDRRVVVAAFIAILAVHARLLMTLFDPQDFDFTSYRMVADIRLDGGNVYAETTRYNYGPIWFWILEAAERATRATGSGVDGFRLAIVTVLSLADVTIGLVLWRRYGGRAALIFLFAPIGLIITGQHHQFDNLAIALGLVGVLVFGQERSGPIRRREIGGLLMIGLSLATKHLLFFFPVWLALGQRGLVRRATVAAIPVVVFGASFLPYLGDGGLDGIRANVFEYRSFANGPMVGWAFGDWIHDTPWPDVVFVGGLGIGALVTRRWRPTDAFLGYLAVVVIASPAVANQYLAIPLAAVAVTFNWVFALWFVTTTAFLAGDPRALGIDSWREWLPDGLTERIGNDVYQPLVALLALGFLWWGVGRRIRADDREIRLPAGQDLPSDA